VNQLVPIEVEITDKTAVKIAIERLRLLVQGGGNYGLKFDNKKWWLTYEDLEGCVCKCREATPQEVILLRAVKLLELSLKKRKR
jgi:hypothetical protein